MEVVYMKVTKDKYELPVAVADTADALAKICGVSVSTVRSSITREKKGFVNSSYKKVIIDDE